PASSSCSARRPGRGRWPSVTRRSRSRTPSRCRRPTEPATAVHLAMLLEMAADGMGERVAFGRRAGGVTMAELGSRARRAGTFLAGLPGERVGLVDLNSEAVPILLFGAALAGKPFVPIN